MLERIPPGHVVAGNVSVSSVGSAQGDALSPLKFGPVKQRKQLCDLIPDPFFVRCMESPYSMRNPLHRAVSL